MQTISIGGKEIKLLFDTGAMELGIDAFGSMEELQSAMRHEKKRNALADVIKLIVVLGNNALDAEGKDMTLTVRWVRHKIDLNDFTVILKAINDAIMESYKREMVNGKDEPVDGYLEEDNTSKNS